MKQQEAINNHSQILTKTKLTIIACKDMCGDGKNPTTMDKYEGFYSPQISPILTALAQKGIELRAINWQEQQNWKQNKIIVGPVWGYHRKINKFFQLLDNLQKQNIVMVNHPKFIKWNAIKSYLVDLKQYLITIPDTLFFNQQYQLGLGKAVDQFNLEYGSSDVIIKGAVDANGESYIHIKEDNFQKASQLFNFLIKEQKGVIMQKFIPQLGKKGQFAFVYFGGKLSHFYLKVPSKGQQRVQSKYGGQCFQIKNDLSDFPSKLNKIKQNFRPDFDLCLEQAQNALKQVQNLQNQLQKMFKNLQIQSPRYLRIDCVIVNNKITIMQLEGIEPYLCLTQAKQNDGTNDTVANYIEGVIKYLI